MSNDPTSGSQLPATKASTSAAGGPVGASAAPPQNLGPSMALEAVSQAAAMAVQDAGSYFRQLTAVSAAAVAVFTAKMVETQSPQPWSDLITAVGTNVTNAGTIIQSVGSDASAVVQDFQKLVN